MSQVFVSLPLLFHLTSPSFPKRFHPVCSYSGCNKRGNLLCSRCLSEQFCCYEHQQKHWNSTETICNHKLQEIAEQNDFDVNQLSLRIRDPYHYEWRSRYAVFYCKNKLCKNTFSSVQVVIELNLVEMKVNKIYTMKCSKCSSVHRKLKPHFDKDFELRFSGLLVFLKNRTKELKEKSDVKCNMKGPHLPAECEKCEYGRNPHPH